MTGGGSKVMKGRMGSSVIVEISEEEVSIMYSNGHFIFSLVQNVAIVNGTVPSF